MYIQDLLSSCFKYLGRRRGGMSTHIPNRVMQNSNKIVRLDVRHFPTAQQAVDMYQQEQQGRISDDSGFGQDPIHADLSKTSIRAQVFGERFPSFEVFSMNW